MLACAPSDAAADILCMRLMKHFSPSEMFRLNWWQRTHTSLPPALWKYSCMVNNGISFDLPCFDKLQGFQIIVSTVVAAGSLQYVHDPRNLYGKKLMFDLVAIDEVSQATEAQTLIPLSLCTDGGVCVIAGDPKQLSANPRSPISRLAGNVCNQCV